MLRSFARAFTYRYIINNILDPAFVSVFFSYSQVHNKRGGGGLKDFKKLLNGGWEQNIKK